MAPTALEEPHEVPHADLVDTVYKLLLERDRWFLNFAEMSRTQCWHSLYPTPNVGHHVLGWHLDGFWYSGRIVGQRPLVEQVVFVFPV